MMSLYQTKMGGLTGYFKDKTDKDMKMYSLTYSNDAVRGKVTGSPRFFFSPGSINVHSTI